jgi:hypothetical protein
MTVQMHRYKLAITNNLKILICSLFAGIVLDESSILKNFEGATKKLILDLFAKTPYKLACTATPSPNDPMELGNHSEFLDVMSRNEMLAMYFVHDGGENCKMEIERTRWKIVLSIHWELGYNAEQTKRYRF